MAYEAKDGNGRVTLTAAQTIMGVVLEDTINDGDVRIRPTNTTAWISVISGSGSTIDDDELENRLILLQNGPKGGFTQGGALANGDYLVSANVKGVITT